MQPLMLLFLIVVIFVCAFAYMTYQKNAKMRAKEKRRNQYHDRV